MSDADGDAIDVERLARTPSAAVTKRVVELAAGEVLAADAASWRDAIVFVTAGAVAVRCVSGTEQQFGTGDILCFARIPIRLLRNRGCGRARLLVVRRCTPLAQRSD
jgi:quercetin dioxygenase-like cupin family protein